VKVLFARESVYSNEMDVQKLMQKRLKQKETTPRKAERNKVTRGTNTMNVSQVQVQILRCHRGAWWSKLGGCGQMGE